MQGAGRVALAKIRPAVLIGGVSFPLTLALSRREREHRIPRGDKSRRSGLAKARRATLPLPKGEGGVRGKARSKHQCACDRAPFDHRQALRPMWTPTLTEGAGR